MDSSRWRRIDALFDAALELDDERRRELLAGEDDTGIRRAVERLLALEAEAESFLGKPVLARSTALDAEPATSDRLVGGRVGPYRLLRLLGHGGMGSVYLAQREDDYRQEVAIKLVRRSLLSRQARRRLHAERQALARLEHPNVARLYDGGTTEDGLPYLVMERVEGMPIDRYCDHHRLTVRRRLELVLQVLAAIAHAHSHLRVHCDIKPSNILVTADGTAKLLDFGIAKLLNPEEQTEIAVTATGWRPMTLRYASPEQILGEPISTATDIYAVGLLLCELLCGRLPYSVAGSAQVEAGRVIVEQQPTRPSLQVASARKSSGRETAASRSPTSDAVAVLAGRRGSSPKELESQLRGDLDAIVLKAIRKQPERRYASAEAFADDLRRHLEARPVTARTGNLRYRVGRFLHRLVLPPNPRRRRERWAWAAAVTAVVGLSSLGFWLNRPPAPCQDSAMGLAGVWDAPGRAAVEKTFLASGLPFAAATWDRVAAALDRYAQAWIATETEACAATEVRGERSPRLLDLTRLCLDGRRQELQALVDLFAQADDALVIDAVAAVSRLSPLHECTDQAELAGRRLPPSDPAVRSRLEAARAVAEAQDLRQRLKEPVDLAALRRLESEVRQLDDPPLLARILTTLGVAESESGGDPAAGETHLEAALLAAVAGGDRPQQIRIYAALIRTLAKQQGDFQRARFWEGFATASLAALSPGYDDLELDVFDALGMLEWHGGDRGVAFAHYRRALASAKRLGDIARQITALNQLGISQQGPNDEEYLDQAIEIIERELGPDHVRLASPLMNLAAANCTQGRYREALPQVRRSEALLRATWGDRQPKLGYPLTLIGQIQIALDRPGEALAPLTEAVDQLMAGFGSSAVVVRDANVALAEAQLLAGKPDAAREPLSRAWAALDSGVAPANPSRLFLLQILGNAQRRSGDLPAALASHLELLHHMDRLRADQPAMAVKPLLAVARTLLAAGRAGEARPLLEEGLRSVHATDRWVKARLRLSLAEAVVGDDPERARRLAAEARSGLSEALPLHRRLLEEIDRWQARR